MSLSQRLAAYLAMLAFGLPSVMIALLGGQAWPFLDYRMYAEAKRSPEVDWLQLVGRTEDGREFHLDHEQYIVPFTPSELLRALEALDVYGGLRLDQAKRLKELGRENGRLKKLVAEQALDNAILKEVSSGNF